MWAQNAGDYRSAGAGGGWGDFNSWEVFDGVSWIPAVTPPTAADEAINILGGDVITVANGDIFVVDQVTINGGGRLNIDAGGELTVLDGPTATDFLVTSVGFSRGTFVINAGGLFEAQGVAVNNIALTTRIFGTYIHNQEGGNIILGVWENGSTLEIQGTELTGPGNLNQSFGNIVYNSSVQQDFIVLGLITLIQNDFIIENTNGAFLVLYSGGDVVNYSIGGNLEINGNSIFFLTDYADLTLDVANDVIITSTGNPSLGLVLGGSAVINVGNDFTVNSGSFTTSIDFTAEGTGSGIINLQGDFDLQSGIVANSGGGSGGIGEFVFTGTLPQIFNNTGEIISNVDFTLESGSEVLAGTSVFTGTGNFDLQTGATIHLGSVAAQGAIQNSTTSGNIRVPVGNRTYASGSRIVYSGAAAQFIGAGHPANPEFELDNAAGASLAASVTMNGPVILTNGNLSIGANTLTLGGTLTANSNFITTVAASNLVVNGSGAFGTFPFAPGGQTLNNVTINRPSGSVIFSGEIDITGGLTLTSGTLRFDDLTLSGTYTNAGGTLAASPNAYLALTGIDPFGTLSFASGFNTLDTLLIERSGATVLLGSTITIGEALIVNDGTLDNTGGVLNMTDNSTLVKDGSAFFTGLQPTINGGTFDVVYTGNAQSTGSEMPSPSETTDLGNLTLNGVSLTLTQNIFPNNGVTLANGELIANGNNITVQNGDWLKQAGTFTPGGTGIVIFSGTSAISGSTPRFGNLRMTETGNLTFPSTNVRVAGFLELSQGGVFNANNGTIILDATGAQSVRAGNQVLFDIDLVNGSRMVNINNGTQVGGLIDFVDNNITLASGGNLTLASNTDGPEGTGLNGKIGELTTGSSVTGDVTVQRFMSAESLGGQGGLYRYISSPVTNATVASWQDDFPITGSFTGTSTGPGLTTNASMFIYQESVVGNLDAGYIPYPVASNSEVLEPGIGYAAWVFGDAATTMDVSGVVNQGDVSLPVTFTSTGNNEAEGWNLLGNPYPSSINWESTDGWDRDGIIYDMVVVRDNGGGGIFRYFGTEPIVSMRTALPNGAIAKGQAFWVSARENLTGGSGNVVIKEAAKRPTSAEFFREGSDIKNQMVIALDWGEYFDEALVAFSEEATDEYDHGLDIPKFNNAYFDISTVSADDKRLAYNYMTKGGCSMEFAIDVSDVWTDEFTMSFRSYETFEVPYEILLMDNYTGETINVRETNAYTFSVDTDVPESFGSGRFRMIFTTDIEELVTLDTEVLTSGNICQGGDATITIPSSQNGVTYQVVINDELYGEGVNGTGENVIFELPNQVFADGENTVRIQASVESCGTSIDLDTVLQISKANLTPEITIEGNRLISNYTEGNQWYFNEELIEGATGQELVAAESGVYTLEVSQSGCVVQASTEYAVTDIEDSFTEAIEIYPVPATTEITVSVRFDNSQRQSTLNVYNAVGELMISRTVNNGDNTINISNWRNGVYLVKVENAGNVQVKRFVKH